MTEHRTLAELAGKKADRTAPAGFQHAHKTLCRSLRKLAEGTLHPVDAAGVRVECITQTHQLVAASNLPETTENWCRAVLNALEDQRGGGPLEAALLKEASLYGAAAYELYEHLDDNTPRISQIIEETTRTYLRHKGGRHATIQQIEETLDNHGVDAANAEALVDAIDEHTAWVDGSHQVLVYATRPTTSELLPKAIWWQYNGGTGREQQILKMPKVAADALKWGGGQTRPARILGGAQDTDGPEMCRTAAKLCAEMDPNDAVAAARLIHQPQHTS